MFRNVSILPRVNRGGIAAQPAKGSDDPSPAAPRPTKTKVSGPHAHRYQVGDLLMLSGGADQVRRTGGACTVVAVLPIERGGSLRYRVKQEKEGFDRIVVEADLVPAQA